MVEVEREMVELDETRETLEAIDKVLERESSMWTPPQGRTPQYLEQSHLI